MKNKRAAIISMVKDECDIIELFVKINTRAVDHIYIIDHDSKDGTTQILVSMINAGYPLTVYRNDAVDFQQPLMITSLARQVAQTDKYDYIVPLDADEFIYCAQGRLADVVSDQIPSASCGALPWMTYVPVVGNYYESEAPLYEVFRKRSIEPMQFYKVVIPNEIAKACVVSEGNHLVTVDGEVVPAIPVAAFLQHLPVRSPEQITAKALLGSHRMSIKVGRGKSIGIHWDQMAEKIRKSNYRLGQSEMLEIAFAYADVLDRPAQGFLVDESAPRVGSLSDKIELKEWSRINLVGKFDEFIRALCPEVRAHRGIVEN